ncbi:MAG: pyrimidine/purine nucleoside phosphorylase [Pseudomonadota bacterium]
MFDNVSVTKKSNIYFDGKCVSHTLTFADGSRKTVGVFFPSTLRFHTAGAEVMEIVDGHCRVRIGDGAWSDYAGGGQFTVPADTDFEVETIELVDYVCHFV